MNKNVLILLAILLFINVSYSQSDEDFNYATTSKDGTEYYVYIEKTTDYSKEIWVKSLIPAKTIKNKKGKYVKVGGGYNLAFIIISCSKKKYDITQTISYDKNGEVTDNNDFISYDERIVPGSVMSGIYNFVCNNEEEINDKLSPYISDESNYNGLYKFKTTFDDPPFEIPLRELPDVNSEEIYKCPKNSIIYVIENSNNIFFKVYVNGYTGYLSNGFLKRKW